MSKYAPPFDDGYWRVEMMYARKNLSEAHDTIKGVVSPLLWDRERGQYVKGADDFFKALGTIWNEASRLGHYPPFTTLLMEERPEETERLKSIRK